MTVRDRILAYGGSEDDIDLVYQEGKGPGACSTNISHQFIYEGLIAGLMIFIGSLGLYFLSQATRNPHDPDRAFNFQTIGVILIIISFLILQGMMKIKGCI